MSLDVYLRMEDQRSESGSGIFVRENGQTKEISRAEWDEKFPGREPLVVERRDEDIVYEDNITHNLNIMAKEAGIYYALWRPDEVLFYRAEQLIKPLEAGLALLLSEPERFKHLNPSNGWGNYGVLVSFVAGYLAACRQWPEAKVGVSR